MGILSNQLENSNLGLKGVTPEFRAGASADNDSKVRNRVHITATRTELEIVGTPKKYLDNLPE